MQQSLKHVSSWQRMHLARKKSHQLAKKKLLIEYSLKLPQSVKHIEEQKLHLPAHLVGCCFHLIWRNSEGLEPKMRQGPPSEWLSESPSLCLPGADHRGNDSTLHIIASFKSHNQWRHKHRQQTSGPGAGRGEWEEGNSNNLEGWDGEGGPSRRGHRYTYGWFMLMFGRNQHNVIKQLSFN